MIGERIRELRKAQGWTQADLAARAGMTQGAVTNLERGARDNPTQDTLDKLARAFGITIADLIGNDYLAGAFPVGQLDREGITAVLPEGVLLRYARLWRDLPRDQRAWLIGHLRVMADAERRVRQWEAAADEDEPGGAAFPTGTHGPPILTSVIT